MFADRLKKIRAEKGMTQVQLAEALGVSKGTIAMWETGKREPNFETLNELSEIFDKRIDYILGYSNDASSPKMTEEEIEKLGVWAAEESFQETVINYLRLDEYGKAAVESLILAELARCREQDTLFPASDFLVSIRLKKEVKDDAERN
ncbi:helix-turn-helix transcriptional regulator [Syntrophomonas curvata]